MPITEAADRNHEELFFEPQIATQDRDPELIEIFDNFAFDERSANSTPKTRVMLILAAVIGSSAVNEYKVMAGAVLNVGVTPIEVKEILLPVRPPCRHGASLRLRMPPMT